MVSFSKKFSQLLLTLVFTHGAHAKSMQAPPSSTEKASTCPLVVAQAPAGRAAPPESIRKDLSCLVDAGSSSLSKASIIDLRERSEFLKFHIPGSESLSIAALITRPRSNTGPVVVYDSGKFQSDAYLLCDRLRRAGMQNFKIMDGGIAAWTQLQGSSEKLGASQLSDQEVATALLDSGNAAALISASFQPVLKEHGIKIRAAGSRKILLGETGTEASDLRQKLVLQPGGSTTLFWLGSKERLSQLLGNHLAQEQKRLSGPSQSQGCGTL